jgi:sulfite dehydrogenase (cytochrome) subunit B
MKHPQCVVAALVCTVCATAGAGVMAAGLKVELPADRATLKPGPGSDLASAQCVICHSADYIITQPPGKPLAFWRAEVEKMKKVYGAPIPEDQIDAVAAYLARTYGSGN